MSTLYLPFMPGTAANVMSGTRAIAKAIGEIASRENMDTGDCMMALSSIVAGTTVAVAGNADAETAGDALAGLTVLMGLLAAGALDALNEPAGERQDEPEIAALKAARGPSSAIN